MATTTSPWEAPFYTSGDTYGSQNDKNWERTPYVRQNLDPQIPSGVFMAYLSKHGLGGTGRESDFAQSQYSKTQSGYQAALRANPGLTYRQYLNDQFGQTAAGLTDLFHGLSASERGEQPNLWAGPARTIAWG